MRGGKDACSSPTRSAGGREPRGDPPTERGPHHFPVANWLSGQ